MNYLLRKVSTVAVLVSAIVLAPNLARCEDQVDAEYHSTVTKKVQQDHQADVQAGKVARKKHGNSGQNSANSSSGGEPSSGSTTTAAPAAAGAGHPTQVQQLQKKKATPPPKTSKATGT